MINDFVQDSSSAYGGKSPILALHFFSNTKEEENGLLKNGESLNGVDHVTNGIMAQIQGLDFFPSLWAGVRWF